MKKILHAVFVSLLLLSTAPQVHAAVVSSQLDSSGTPSHYWHSDGSTGAYLALDPTSGGPGYAIGTIATTTSTVLGIHIKAMFTTGGAFSALPSFVRLYDESGNNPYTCASMPFGGYAYGTPSDALTLSNPLTFAQFNNTMVDMYFQCALGAGHDEIFPATSYRLYLYPVSTADVSDIFVAMDAAGVVPFYEVSGDGNYPPPPAPITISAPAQGTTYFSTDTIVPQATIANISSYTSITYLLNGTAIDPTQPLPMAALPAGTSTLVIAATNSTETVYATSTFIVIGGQPPAIAIISPLNGHTYLQNDVASINAVVTDPYGVATTTYTLNGIPIDPAQMLPFMNLPLGTATLAVSATNIYGNTGYATSTFTIAPPDVTPPTITISNPTAGATYTDTATVLAAATVTDASPIAAVTYTFNGTTIDPSLPLPLLGAPLGPAAVSVAATDIYGNAASSTVSFTIKSSDVTPPTITITNPVAGHTYNSTDNVFAVASISDASGIASNNYTLNDITIDPAVPLPLTSTGAGPAVLVVTATDNFGNTASSSVTFTITTPPPPDTTGPSITIISPYPGKKYSRNDSVSVVATITDPSGIASTQYFFNGKQIDPTKSLNFSKAPLGTATFKVIATDTFGNSSSSTVTFRILPGSNSCIADITEAFDHKWIANKNVFKDAFEDCKKIQDREHDRNDYDNDNHKKGKDSHNDDRYIKAQKDIDDALEDINQRIHN